MGDKIPFKYDPDNKFVLPGTNIVASSSDVQQMIAEQAKKKGWSTDPTWLMASWAKEIFEVWQAWEHAGKCEVWLTEEQRQMFMVAIGMFADSCKDDTEIKAKAIALHKMLEGKTTKLDEILAKEYGDSEYFKNQSMLAIAPNINLDAAVKCVYDNNEANAKKTYLGGKIVEK